MKETYSLHEASKLFKTDTDNIKARCATGELDFLVDGNGYYHITRESILKHLTELEMKHNR